MTKRCDECTFFGSVDQYSGRCFRNEFRVSCAGSCPSHVAAVDPAEVIEPDAVSKALEKINQHLEKLEQQHDEMLSMLKAQFTKKSLLHGTLYVDENGRAWEPDIGMDLAKARW